MKKFFIVLLVGVVGFAVGYFLAARLDNHFRECAKKSSSDHFAEASKIVIRDTITVTDTMTIYKPYPIIEYVGKTDTLIVNDTIFVEIPISTKVYEDSLYKAWVSGYKPSLDSLVLFQPKEVITEQVFVPKIEKKRARWGIGIQAGYGTDFQEFSPYIGVGVHYNVFSW